MLAKLFQILHQELQLYRAALETEREKRRAILAADGRRMQEYTKKTEALVREAGALEQKREQILDELARTGVAFVNQRPSLRELLVLGESAADLDPGLFALVRDHFSATVSHLKTETEENRRLLGNTARSLHNALTDLQNRVDPRDERYRPGGSRQAKVNAPVLLNANA